MCSSDFFSHGQEKVNPESPIETKGNIHNRLRVAISGIFSISAFPRVDFRCTHELLRAYDRFRIEISQVSNHRRS